MNAIDNILNFKKDEEDFYFILGCDENSTVSLFGEMFSFPGRSGIVTGKCTFKDVFLVFGSFSYFLISYSHFSKIV